MTLSDNALSILAVVSLGISLLALALVILGRSAAGPGRPRAQTPSPKRLEPLVEAQAKAIRRLDGALRQLMSEQRRVGQISDEAVRHVGVVRFDAFEDMGGRLSFSAAFLDGHRDGVVITSINGRQDTRCYAKPVRGGESGHNLTDEEREAIRKALEGDRQIAEAR